MIDVVYKFANFICITIFIIECMTQFVIQHICYIFIKFMSICQWGTR